MEWRATAAAARAAAATARFRRAALDPATRDSRNARSGSEFAAPGDWTASLLDSTPNFHPFAYSTSLT